METRRKPTKEEIRTAELHLQEKNIRIPLFNITGVFLVDEAEFTFHQYSQEEKRYAWVIANALNSELIDPVSFLEENQKRNYPAINSDISYAFSLFTGRKKN